MIIDDKHQVFFQHIPKCGGTSVRTQLQAVDSYNGQFYGLITHETLGSMDLAHLPLYYFHACYPEQFAKLETYQSFAIVRNPYARFVSATFERLAVFRGIRQTAATPRVAMEEAEAAIAWLRGRERFCDAGYIHFARQTDFISLNGRRMIRNIHTLEDMAGLGAGLSRITGLTFDPETRKNTNFASANKLMSVLHIARPIYRKLTTLEQREEVLKLLHRWKIQSPDKIYAEFTKTPMIRSFIDDYYADDIVLYEAVRAATVLAQST
jgi:hypothetical protein